MFGFCKEMFQKYKSILLYLVFGVATTVVNWLVYAPCTKLFGDGITNTELAICNAIAWVAAVTFAYITNKLFVFDSHCRSWQGLLGELGRFFGARVFSGLFEIFLPSVLLGCGLDQTILGIEGALAKGITSVLVIVMNYVLSKLVVFRKKK